MALGAWQTYRLFWKIEINEFRTEQIESNPVLLPQGFTSLEDWNYRPVFVEGKFQHDREIYLAARSFRSQVGYQIITPLETTNGRIVLVNRGWVPDRNKNPSTRSQGQLDGIVRISGLLTLGQQDSLMKPNNVPDENFWFWIDLKAISSALQIPLQSFVIDAGSAKNPGGLPIGAQTRILLRNEHLSYAIVWYSLAIALGIITLVIRRRAVSTIVRNKS